SLSGFLLLHDTVRERLNISHVFCAVHRYSIPYFGPPGIGMLLTKFEYVSFLFCPTILRIVPARYPLRYLRRTSLPWHVHISFPNSAHKALERLPFYPFEQKIIKLYLQGIYTLYNIW